MSTASIQNNPTAYTAGGILILLILAFLSASPVEAQVYKYRAPNGKLLFTDKEVFDQSYTLLELKDFRSKPAGSAEDLPSKFQSYIFSAARRHGVDESLIKAIIKAESDFDPNALSKAGAQGLMQLMPKTARNYNVYNSYNSQQNIEAGTKHIKYLLEKYKNNLTLALAAYNAGETAVNKYGGIPPYPETQNYVKKVFKFKKEYENNRL